MFDVKLGWDAIHCFQSGDGPNNMSLLCDYKRASCGPSFEALAAGR